MNSTPETAPAKPLGNKENPLFNLIANVVLPVFILHRFSAKAPVPALLVALALPLGYGIWSYFNTRKLNFVSVLGLLNISVTGTFALLQLDGFWFTIKEAAFPFLIGCFVLASSFRPVPFLKMMLLDTGALNTEEIDTKLREAGREDAMHELVKRATILFSLTFFFSALMNFLIAYKTFTAIPLDLTPDQRSAALNLQIASMTWKAYAMVFTPSICLFFVILYFFFRKLTKLTGIPFDQLVKN